MMHRKLSTLIAAVILVAALPATAAPERVVAIGDVHGEYQSFVSILQRAELIDDKQRWSGGAATLVQTGDYLDRGADVKRVLDLMMSLDTAAPRRRGRVIVLLGNHEVMNIAGILSDLNPAAYAAFADRKSEQRRTAAYRQYVALHERLATRYPAGSVTTMPEAEWMKAHPPGFIEYQQAFDRDGKYGKWLRTKPAIAKVGDTVFLHGGLSPKMGELTIDKINAQVRLEIEGIDRIREYLAAQKLTLPFFTFAEMSEVAIAESKRGDVVAPDLRRIVDAIQSLYRWSVMDPDGPLWFRGFAEWSDETGEENLPQLLNQFGARRFVVGHTIPQDPRHMLPRFGGRVILIDTGMVRGFPMSGRASALEISADSVTAIYETERVDLKARPAPSVPAGSWLGPNNSILPFRTAEEVTAFLRTAQLVEVDKKKLSGVTKPQRVIVEGGGVRARAVFRALHREEENAKWEDGTFTEFLRDSYHSEIAAYELAVLLGLDTVPPTVSWQLDGQPGALQIYIEKARAGFHPAEAEKPADPVRYGLEMDLMRPFDALIANIDRHEGNMLVDSRGKLWWIDHTRSFGRDRVLVNGDSIQRCDRVLWERLKTLDAATVTARLAPHMSAKEIDALLVRRDLLIARIEKLIAEKGEGAVLVERRAYRPSTN
jgi:hypothetical protein